MNLKNICVFDFETDGVDPDICNPVQLSAIIIHPRSLKVIKKREFDAYIKPPDINEEDYYEQHKNTIDWHAKIQKKSVEDVLAQWRSASDEKDVWQRFIKYLTQYHTTQTRQSPFTAPLAAGYNILEFDMKIINRLCQKYGQLDKNGKQSIFFNRDKIDLLLFNFLWFENNDELKNYSFDNLRQYFGMKTEGAHNSLVDVKQCGELLIRFLQLHRRLSPKVQFKKSFQARKYYEKNSN